MRLDFDKVDTVRSGLMLISMFVIAIAAIIGIGVIYMLANDLTVEAMKIMMGLITTLVCIMCLMILAASYQLHKIFS